MLIAKSPAFAPLPWAWTRAGPAGWLAWPAGETHLLANSCSKTSHVLLPCVGLFPVAGRPRTHRAGGCMREAQSKFPVSHVLRVFAWKPAVARSACARCVDHQKLLARACPGTVLGLSLARHGLALRGLARHGLARHTFDTARCSHTGACRARSVSWAVISSFRTVRARDWAAPGAPYFFCSGALPAPPLAHTRWLPPVRPAMAITRASRTLRGGGWHAQHAAQLTTRTR